MKRCIKGKSEKNVMRPKGSGLMTSAETSNYNAEELSRQSTKTKNCSSTGCLKSKNSDIILKKRKKTYTDEWSSIK